MIENIEVSELLSTSAREKSINYCGILKKALSGDKNAIKELSLLEFNNAVGYDHGSVLVDFITFFGEEKYIKSISAINKDQKILIKSYIEIGLNYGSNTSVNGKDIISVFPNLYSFLKN